MRIGFIIGPFLTLVIIFLRRHIPDKPRWLVTHGRSAEADTTVDEIERRVETKGVTLSTVPESTRCSSPARPSERAARRPPLGFGRV